MKVALFSGNYNYLREGANQALNRAVHHLEAKAGCKVRVYSPVGDRPVFEPAGTLVSVPSIPMPVRSEFRLAVGLPTAVRRDIESFAPDMVTLKARLLRARAGDIEIYANKVMALISDAGARQQIGTAAREASLSFSWDAASESVARAYRTVLGERVHF